MKQDFWLAHWPWMINHYGVFLIWFCFVFYFRQKNTPDAKIVQEGSLLLTGDGHIYWITNFWTFSTSQLFQPQVYRHTWSHQACFSIKYTLSELPIWYSCNTMVNPWSRTSTQKVSQWQGLPLKQAWWHCINIISRSW